LQHLCAKLWEQCSRLSLGSDTLIVMIELLNLKMSESDLRSKKTLQITKSPSICFHHIQSSISEVSHPGKAPLTKICQFSTKSQNKSSTKINKSAPENPFAPYNLQQLPQIPPCKSSTTFGLPMKTASKGFCQS
jgi:hypothetical protein